MRSEEIYARVLAAMQDAEEMGGPEGEEYVQMMERISAEAAARASAHRHTMSLTALSDKIAVYRADQPNKEKTS